MKIKKFMLPFISLIILIIIAVIVFIILVTNSNKSDPNTSAPDVTPIVTLTPTPAVTPAITPEPTKIPVDVTKLYPASEIVNNQKLYGYIDKTGTFAIDPSFDMASEFSNGAAYVTFNGKNCVIDEGGNILFTDTNSIGSYSNGLASFSSYDGNETTTYGYVDKTGTVVIQAKYSLVTNFNQEGFAYVSTGSGKYAKIDKTGKELETYELDNKYDYPINLQDGYLVYSNKDSKYGIINMKGEEILKPIYGDIAYLGNDLFAVKSPDFKWHDDVLVAKQAIFNQKGEQLTDYIYYNLTPYHEGYCSATDDTSTFFVGLDGKEATTLPRYDGIGTLKLFGDVVSAFIDGDQLYSTLDKTIFWQMPTTYPISDQINVTSVKFRPNRLVLVNYPQIEGLSDATVQAQINTQLKSIFTDKRKDTSVKDLLTVEDHFSAKLLKNLLVIERDGYDYILGAAHGMPIQDYIYLDITTGTAYQLKDLFKAGSDYMTKINELIKDELATQTASGDAMLFPDSFTGIKENQYFKLDPDALIIYFYPYDIAAYAAGFPEFTIPFDDIMDYIDTEGAFWNSFHN